MSDWTLVAGVDGVVGVVGGDVGGDDGGDDGGDEGGLDGPFDVLEGPFEAVWLDLTAVIDEHELNTSDMRPNTTIIPTFFKELTRGHEVIAKTHERRRNAERHFIVLGTCLRLISGVEYSLP